MSGKKTFLRNELADLGIFSIAIGVHQQIIVSAQLLFALCYEGFRVPVGGLRWAACFILPLYFAGSA
jgi:hypothetical protein